MCFVAWFCLAVVRKVVTGIDMFARFVNWVWGYVGWFVFVVLCGGWCCFVWFWMINVLLGFVLSA